MDGELEGVGTRAVGDGSNEGDEICASIGVDGNGVVEVGRGAVAEVPMGRLAGFKVGQGVDTVGGDGTCVEELDGYRRA